MAEELNKIDPREKAPQQNVTPGTGVPGETESDTILVPHRALQGSAMPAVVSTIFASSGDADLTPHVLKNVTHAFCYMHEIVDFAISVPHTLRSAEKMANRGSKLWHSKNKQSDCPQQEVDLFSCNHCSQSSNFFSLLGITCFILVISLFYINYFFVLCCINMIICTFDKF